MPIQINPHGSMQLLSQLEVDRLKQAASGKLYRLYRNCSLAVLNVGSHTDDSQEIYQKYESFKINIVRRDRGVKLELFNPPEHAFVDDKLIRGIQEHLFAVLRDLLYISEKYESSSGINLTSASHITHVVFDILRNANVILPNTDPNMIVCWGGHSIDDIEYQYTKEVGYQLGLRGLNICTGCGPGAMKGPMKGATIGHAKQRITNGRYLGVTEPSIIAAEPPNPIVNELVILPDIEKRLEGFIRLAHGIIIFPGGAGTAEELLYLLGIMLHEENKEQRIPVILTGPAKSRDYFDELDKFIGEFLGEEAQSLYEIIVDDPQAVAQTLSREMVEVRATRKASGDAYHYNWSLKIEPEFQLPFDPTHENMANLDLFPNQSTAQLAANLRRAFSGIVAGNVKEFGILSIQKHGPYKIHGDKALMKGMDNLLQAFCAQGRMKLSGEYKPCYEIVK